MKPGVPSVVALVTATTISVIAGASPTVDRRSTPQVPAQPTPAERLEISVNTVRSYVRNSYVRVSMRSLPA